MDVSLSLAAVSLSAAVVHLHEKAMPRAPPALELSQSFRDADSPAAHAHPPASGVPPYMWLGCTQRILVDSCHSGSSVRYDGLMPYDLSLAEQLETNKNDCLAWFTHVWD